MTHFLTATALAGLAVLLGVLHALAPAAGAHALSGAGHGPGYLSADGWWLGTYRLDDGAQGFCLNAGKQSPTGHTLDYVDGAELGWFTDEQSARLAYISRTWAGTGDRLTAAAGQIATWMVAGLGGRTPESYAARAGADAPAVLARAVAMAEESARLATTAVRAEAVVELAETGPGRLRVELTVDRLTGSEVLSPSAHTAVATLDGARFADGSTSATIATGTDVPILPDGQEASIAVTATASFTALPYGSGLRIAVPRSDAQSLLMAVPASATASAGASIAGPSPLPFQPRVETRTSAAAAAPGAEITDHLVVSVDTGDGLLPAWGVRASDDGLEPIEAVVESRLLGPFAEPIRLAPTVPDDAPVVCSVETVVTGAGEYETPSCTLPADGHYVWVERIDPARIAPELGGARVRPWQSAFGVASEVTRAVAPAVAGPAATAAPVVASTTELAATGSGAGEASLGWGIAGLTTVGLGALALAVGGGRRRRAETSHLVDAAVAAGRRSGAAA